MLTRVMFLLFTLFILSSVCKQSSRSTAGGVSKTQSPPPPHSHDCSAVFCDTCLFSRVLNTRLTTPPLSTVDLNLKNLLLHRALKVVYTLFRLFYVSPFNFFFINLRLILIANLIHLQEKTLINLRGKQNRALPPIYKAKIFIMRLVKVALR